MVKDLTPPAWWAAFNQKGGASARFPPRGRVHGKNGGSKSGDLRPQVSMIRLVVNAEGFGATRASNLDIARAHREGVVTSTSLLGNCADIADARASLAELPALGVGLSLALWGGTPVATQNQDGSSPLAPGRLLRGSPSAFAMDWLKGRIPPEHVEREMEAQVSRALGAGVALDHLCTRGHLGFVPGVGELVERVARRHKIAGIRSIVESPTLGWLADPRRGLQLGVLTGLSWVTRRRLGTLRHGPRTWGYLESGRLDEVRIIEIIGRLGPGGHELICHPGGTNGPGPTASDAAGDGAVELRALTSAKVKTALDRRAIVLCRWRDLF